MRAVSTRIDTCEGHDACPPREPTSWSPDVTVENLEVVRVDDTLAEHGCRDHQRHGAKITEGYSTVTVNGQPIACVGATVDCDSGKLKTGRGTVTVG